MMIGKRSAPWNLLRKKLPLLLLQHLNLLLMVNPLLLLEEFDLPVYKWLKLFESVFWVSWVGARSSKIYSLVFWTSSCFVNERKCFGLLVLLMWMICSFLDFRWVGFQEIPIFFYDSYFPSMFNMRAFCWCYGNHKLPLEVGCSWNNS